MTIYYSAANNAFYDDAIFGSRMVSVVDQAAQEKSLASAKVKDDAEYDRAVAKAKAEEKDEPTRGSFQKRQADVVASPIMKLVPNADCKLPEDAIEISTEVHARMLQGQAEGSAIVPGRQGAPSLQARTPSVEDVLASARKKRDQLLRDTDWTQMSDAPLSEAKRKLWAEHRQALRDLPKAIEAALANGSVAPGGDLAHLLPEAPQ